ncbi:MAG TPA: hypothetical protein VM187_13915 [Niastella sp.]|nr:hypothetical protein [Niastella sp.]
MVGLPESFLSQLEIGLPSIPLPPELAHADWQTVLLYLVPSWPQKGTKLLSKKAWYLISILSLASQPVRMSELLSAMNYKNQKTFRDNYLTPLRQAGFIEFTNPEKPTDPDNKYRITEAGKTFLGGLI